MQTAKNNKSDTLDLSKKPLTNLSKQPYNIREPIELEIQVPNILVKPVIKTVETHEVKQEPKKEEKKTSENEDKESQGFGIGFMGSETIMSLVLIAVAIGLILIMRGPIASLMTNMTTELSEKVQELTVETDIDNDTDNTIDK